jgi:uncharacterized protein YndB with AHSA1/START domain
MPSPTEVVIQRTIHAPPETVFDAWTEAEHIEHWMTGLPGWRTVSIESDAREGGTYTFSWAGPAGEELTISGTYHEVERPHRLVSSDAWEGWPATTNTLILEEEGGATLITLTIRYDSEEQRDRALATGATDGLAGTLANLDAYLADR